MAGYMLGKEVMRIRLFHEQAGRQTGTSAAILIQGSYSCSAMARAREAKPRMRKPGGSPRGEAENAETRFPQRLPRVVVRKRPPPQVCPGTCGHG